MTDPVNELGSVLSSIARLAAEGRELFDADPRQRWSIERLWIFAGNLAEQHRRANGLPSGAEPWAELVGIRNVYAHYTPEAINPNRVWHDTIGDIDRISASVRDLT